MYNPMFTRSYASKDLAYTTGDVLSADINLPVDGLGKLMVAVSAAVKLNMEVDGVSKALNNDANLTADAWYFLDIPIPRNKAVNFSFSGAATAQFYLNIIEYR